MITKTINPETQRPEITVTLSVFDTLEDIERLKNALLFCVKTVSQSDVISADTLEIWDVCTLIEDLSLTPDQCLKADKLLFQS